jgi:phosphatidylglycerol:prolipoprotein diacylglycerol transferase
MVAVGFICALMVAYKRAKNKGLNTDVVFKLCMLALIMGFIGAKILFVIIEIEEMLKNPLQIISGSGFVVYGGIISGFLSLLIYCRIKKISSLQYCDLLAPSVAIAQGFGRIGCLLAGCCYGAPTELPIGIMNHSSFAVPNGVSLFPTQIILSIGCFLLAFLLIVYARKDRVFGRVSALYLMFYSVGRFFIEFLRADYRGEIGIFSTAQFISFPVLIVGIVLFNADRLCKVKHKNI